LESFSAARVAAYEALVVINRKPGSAEVVIYKEEEDDLGETTRSRRSAKSKADIEEAKEPEVKAVLPKYTINSISEDGVKPKNVVGKISVKNVHFSYPTRPNEKILKGMNVEIVPGQTVAFVGPSGGGKSTIVAMLERFYDPLSGSIELDGVDLKDYNVKYLRSLIGYVGQEPTLFATTIRGNIRYGNPEATEEQIVEAAKMANAHDFISAFTEGYDTQVGDKGSQLSGGQKQRIAIGECR
jgi:ABC-type multidrug transport system fused ATPase/permease subunit